MMKHDTLKNAYFVSWETHLRSRSICKQLDIPLYEIVSSKPRLVRYIILILKTLRLYIGKPRSHVVIVQNPSIVLALLTNFFCILTRRKCVVDCHNGGIVPLDGISKVLNWLARLSIRLSDYSIVTNQNLAEVVLGMGGRPLVLPDALPDFQAPSEQTNSAIPEILFICTWASDEPYLEVIEACGQLSSEVKVHITGNFKKKQDELSRLDIPANVNLTGFISDEEFHRLLETVSIVMDLTTREDCLVCGAYEATAMEKPMILSDTKALRKYFSKGAVYAENSTLGITDAIEEALAHYDELSCDIRQLKTDLTESWKLEKQALISKIELLEIS